MANIYEDITKTIGNTPLVRINRLNKDGFGIVLAKLESFNPLSSIKDRVGISMIEDAEKKGLLKKGSIIVEPTSGNTGIALAFIASVKGYRLIITMPETMSVERKKLLEFFGAEVVLTEGLKGMQGAIEKAEEIKNKYSNAIILKQFSNPSNTQIHRKTTAEEIWRDTDGKIDIFISGIGTGGTITGVGEVLKSRKPDVKIIALEPENSAVLSGNQPGEHKIQGIGAGFIPDILNLKIIDEIVRVKDDDAFFMVKRLAQEEGILAGISSGAAMWVALEISKRKENKDKNIVVILPDTGERYLSIL